MSEEEVTGTSNIESAHEEVVTEATPTVEEGSLEHKFAEKAAEIAESEAPAETPASTEEYTPNYKYNVHNEEFEFDEALRGVVTNKEIEEALRTLHAKAGGIDEVQKSRDSWSERFETLNGQHGEVMGQVNKAADYLKNNDMGSLLKTLGIPEEKVFEYALQRVKYNELPPEQQAAYDEYNTLKTTNHELQKTNQTIQGEWEEFQTQTRERELDTVLTRPEVASLATAYDTQKGSQGIFKDKVIALAASHEHITGEEMTAEQAVAEVTGLMAMGGTQSAQPIIQVPGSKPVIPNVMGSASSPTRKKFTSFDQIRKHGDSLPD